MINRPGAALANRPLHFIWLVDCSGSMSIRGKIQSLNVAIKEAIPHMQKVADENPNAQVLVRAIAFSNGAMWHIPHPTPLEQFTWTDMDARPQSVTAMGKALSLVAEALDETKMPDRAIPPVLVMLSDGQPTDDFTKGLKDLMDKPWGRKAVRIAIAIGEDADYEVLQKFIGHSELHPLSAKNPEALAERIRWASTVVLKSASSPAVQPQGGGGAVPVPTPIPVPVPLDATVAASADDIW